jgi:hypothetical protein
MEVVSTSETSVSISQAAERNAPEDSHHHTHAYLVIGIIMARCIVPVLLTTRLFFVSGPSAFIILNPDRRLEVRRFVLLNVSGCGACIALHVLAQNSNLMYSAYMPRTPATVSLQHE